MKKLKHLLMIAAVVALVAGSVGSGTVGADPGHEWTVPMVADAGGDGQNTNLEFGIHAAATDGYDSGIDMGHPPPPPVAPAFEAYFSIVHHLFPRLNKDFRGDVPNEWTLIVYSTEDDTVLSWDATGVPDDVSLTLVGVPLEPVDMKQVTTTTLPAGDHTLTITAEDVDLPPVGGTAHPISRLPIVALWIALGAAIVAGAGLLMRRRRATR